MKKYVLLISDRYDSSNRYWVRESDLDRAKKVAHEYEKYNRVVEIYEISDDMLNK